MVPVPSSLVATCYAPFSDVQSTPDECGLRVCPAPHTEPCILCCCPLSSGVSYNNRTDRFLAGATARKQFQLGNTETWLKASQDLYYDYAAQEVNLVRVPYLRRGQCPTAAKQRVWRR